MPIFLLSPTPSNTPSNTPTNTPSGTACPTPTAQPTNTPTPSITASNTPTLTPTSTQTPTPSVTVGLTPTATPTNTITPSNSPTNTTTPSSTPNATPTTTATNTMTPTKSNTPTPSITASNTQTPTLTPTNTQTPTNTSTVTPSPTKTPQSTSTPTMTPTQTMTQTNTPTPSVTIGLTPTATPTNTPTQSPYSLCPQQIVVSNHQALPELDGTYDRVYSYSGGGYNYGTIDFTSNYIFIPGPYLGNNYPVFVNTSPGSPFTATTLAYSRITNSWNIFEGSVVDNTIVSDTIAFSSTTISYGGGLYPTGGWKDELLTPGLLIAYLSYPSVCPTPTPSQTLTTTPTVTPTPSITASNTQTPTTTPTHTPTQTPTATNPSCTTCFEYTIYNPNLISVEVYYTNCQGLPAQFTLDGETIAGLCACEDSIYADAFIEISEVGPCLPVTATQTPTPTKTPTQTPSNTPTISVTPSVTATRTPTVTPTKTPAVTPSPTMTKTPTSTPTKTPTTTPTASCAYKQWLIAECTGGTCRLGTCECRTPINKTVYTACNVSEITDSGTAIYTNTGLTNPFTGDFQRAGIIWNSTGSDVVIVCTVGGPC